MLWRLASWANSRMTIRQQGRLVTFAWFGGGLSAFLLPIPAAVPTLLVWMVVCGTLSSAIRCPKCRRPASAIGRSFGRDRYLAYGWYPAHCRRCDWDFDRILKLPRRGRKDPARRAG